jgi:hypothetical protein
MPVQLWDPISTFGALSSTCIYRRYERTHISRYCFLLSSAPTQIITVVAYFAHTALYPPAVTALRNL